MQGFDIAGIPAASKWNVIVEEDQQKEELEEPWQEEEEENMKEFDEGARNENYTCHVKSNFDQMKSGNNSVFTENESQSNSKLELSFQQ